MGREGNGRERGIGEEGREGKKEDEEGGERKRDEERQGRMLGMGTDKVYSRNFLIISATGTTGPSTTTTTSTGTTPPLTATSKCIGTPSPTQYILGI